MIIEILYQATGKYLLYSRLFSTAVATLTSFLLAMVLFKPYISYLQKLRFSSELEANSAAHDPVMPAGILFFAIIFPVVLCTTRINGYVISALIVYTFFSLIGAVDDVAKVINKKRLARGEISKEDYMYKADGISSNVRLTLYIAIAFGVALLAYKYIPDINGRITIPFLSTFKAMPYFPFWLFIPLMAMTIAVLANGVNFTDGFDTLATVPLITCAIFVGIVAYISDNEIWTRYLLIPHIPGVEEILPMLGAMVGVLLAFLWFNAPPSSIIMGDSGSVGLGGTIGVMFVFVKAVFYLPIIGFIFMLEFVSDILQIGYFKMTRKRLFLMAPIHHHFQIKMRKSGRYANEFLIKSKIAWRFHIISIILLVVGLIVFFKVR